MHQFLESVSDTRNRSGPRRALSAASLQKYRFPQRAERFACRAAGAIISAVLDVVVVGAVALHLQICATRSTIFLFCGSENAPSYGLNF